jgi:adenylylsulfate kinase
MNKILIMGLPGAGKTFLARALKKYIESYSAPMEGCFYDVAWFNADEIRKKFNDWDFSHDGRIRQSIRMAKLAMYEPADFVIADFVSPLVEMRKNFNADWTIWVDTIHEGRFADTNKAFIPPEKYDFRVTEQDAEKWAKIIGTQILS